MTCQEALQRGASQLSASPELREDALKDAALLLMRTLGIDRATLRAHPEASVTRDQQATYQAMLNRRLLFEPIQYITGEQEFYGLAFKVTSAVLIPRPETELLVEAVVERLKKDEAARIVDVGTGSGAIAVALAHLLPKAEVWAVDVSTAALAVARENADRHNVTVGFIEGDLLSGLEGEFDVVVSNPPYVPSGDAAAMHPQVREFEPGLALFAGTSGMNVYERLIPQARAALKAGGLLAIEIGFGQRAAIEGLLDGWDRLEFLQDLQGIDRVALARRP